VPTNTPVATNTPTQENASSNTAVSSSSECTDQKPGDKAPELYAAIAQSANEILVYFTDAQSPYDRYVIEYGTEKGVYTFGSTHIGGVGTRTYTIGSLSANTKYFFRIRAGNGCATGNWSNEISATTKSLFALNNLAIVESELTPSTVTPSTPSNVTQNVPGPSSAPSIAPVEAFQVTGGSTPEDTQTMLAEYGLTIKVVDKKNQPVANAKVTVHSNVQEGKTDNQGIINFKSVEPGEHRVIIAYESVKGEQTIHLSGATPAFNLTVTVEEKNSLSSPIVLMIITIGIVTIVLLIFYIFRLRKKRFENNTPIPAQPVVQ
jgi:hypothetical protein